MDIEQYQSQQGFFRGHAKRFIACVLMIQNVEEMDGESFPPSTEPTQKAVQWVIDNAGELLGKKEHEELEQEFLLYTFANNVVTFYEDPQSAFEKLDIKEEGGVCFILLADFCAYVSSLYEWATQHEELRNDELAMFNIQQIGQLVICKAYEAMGYWTAKMEEKKRNSENSKVKSLCVKRNEKEVKRLLEKHKGKVTRAALAEMMITTDRGERTVKNLVARILDQQ